MASNGKIALEEIEDEIIYLDHAFAKLALQLDPYMSRWIVKDQHELGFWKRHRPGSERNERQYMLLRVRKYVDRDWERSINSRREIVDVPAAWEVI